ncbi:hypothetical protein MRX96_007876 [Rhipicephalus microplus]
MRAYLLDVDEKPPQVDAKAAHTPAPRVKLAAAQLSAALHALGTLVTVTRHPVRHRRRRRGDLGRFASLRRRGRLRDVGGLTVVAAFRRWHDGLAGRRGAAGWGRGARRDAHEARRTDSAGHPRDYFSERAYSKSRQPLSWLAAADSLLRRTRDGERATPRTPTPSSPKTSARIPPPQLAVNDYSESSVLAGRVADGRPTLAACLSLSTPACAKTQRRHACTCMTNHVTNGPTSPRRHAIAQRSTFIIGTITTTAACFGFADRKRGRARRESVNMEQTAHTLACDCVLEESGRRPRGGGTGRRRRPILEMTRRQTVTITDIADSRRRGRHRELSRSVAKIERCMCDINLAGHETRHLT